MPSYGTETQVVSATFIGLPGDDKDQRCAAIFAAHDGCLEDSGTFLATSQRDVYYRVPAEKVEACVTALRVAGFNPSVEEPADPNLTIIGVLCAGAFGDENSRRCWAIFVAHGSEFEHGGTFEKLALWDMECQVMNDKVDMCVAALRTAGFDPAVGEAAIDDGFDALMSKHSLPITFTVAYEPPAP